MKISTNNLRVVAVLLLAVSFSTVYLKDTITTGEVLAATSPWVQTDWSGGQTDDLATDIINTYKEVSNVNTGNGDVVDLEVLDDWIDTDWGYRKKIDIDNTDLNIGLTSENLTEFPVLVTLDSDNIDYSLTNDDGSDLLFVDSDGSTQLAHQIETWDENATSYVWVKIPSIDVNSDQDYFYMYYGNEDAVDDQDPAAVWSNNFVAVWLLNDPLNTTNVLDSASTPTSEDGTLFTGLTNSNKIQSGIGGALSFTSASTDHIVVGQPSDLNFVPNVDEFTIDAWIKSPINGNGAIIGKTTNVNAAHQYHFYVSGNTLQARVGGTARNTGAIVADDNWHHVVLRNYATPTLRFYQYVDGTLRNSSSVSGSGVNNFDVLLGARRNSTNANYTSSMTAGVEMSMIRIADVARSDAWIAATYKSENNEFLTYNENESIYKTSGYLVSNIIDTEALQDWGAISFVNVGSPVMSVKVRAGNESDLSDTSDWTACNNITSGSDMTANNCVDDKSRYIQYRVAFSTTVANTPVLDEITLNFVASDLLSPPTNATNISIDNFTTGEWTNTKSVIEWDAGTDNPGGSGILGYCVSLDEAEIDSSHLLDPASSGGLLQSIDDGVDDDNCPYIVTNTTLDLSTVTGLELDSGKQYYFSIKAIDNSGNTFNAGAYQDLISFKYDNEPALPPSYISLPSNFLSSKDVTITWASSGAGSASDAHSGLLGLQYRIGQSGTWYGDLHLGTEDENDLLVNDGSYTTDLTYDYPALQEGSNFVYFRAIDNLGNVTAENNYVTGVIKLNTSAPSAVQNIQVTPANSTSNSYSFSWNTPASFVGSASGMRYCYTINILPDTDSCIFTQSGVTSLLADSFATKPGTNTFYVVAQDEALNINYEVYSSVTFSYSGSAPGIPTSLDISDISIKAVEQWRLVVSWNGPTDVGAGVDHYDIYRSETTATCSSELNNFTKVGSSNSTSYIDPDLEQKPYYYCIRSCDSANNCSASSQTASRTPTGKFTEPALLVEEPTTESVTTRKALINWTTDRVSDSRIEYGLESGIYFEEEVSNSTQVIGHTITLNNLTPGTTYFYRAKWTDVDGNTGVSDEKSFVTLPPPIVSNVSATSITTSSAIINFKVTNSTRATIVYGLSESYGGTREVPTSTQESEYSVAITSLEDGQLYNYKFILQDIDQNENDTVVNFQFQTLPYPEISNLRFEEVKNTSQPTIKISWETNVETLGYASYVKKGSDDEEANLAETKYAKKHLIELAGLSTNTVYELSVVATDRLGNQVTSAVSEFTTATDSRPPVVSNVIVESRIANANADFGTEVFAQLIVTWDTDELATSQVQYMQGTSGEFTQKTIQDENLTFNHTVVVNNLSPSSVYKIQVLSKDGSGNEGEGRPVVTISSQASENPLEIILGRLSEVFAFIR